MSFSPLPTEWTPTQQPRFGAGPGQWMAPSEGPTVAEELLWVNSLAAFERVVPRSLSDSRAFRAAPSLCLSTQNGRFADSLGAVQRGERLEMSRRRKMRHNRALEIRCGKSCGVATAPRGRRSG